ncbi:methyltransferase domain-containing protein [Tistrella bauzanensis]|uniref:methyltransferase domain-containing protein n=1 Tax=Tistrella TaxID=171436 RepID=UPI0031F6229A
MWHDIIELRNFYQSRSGRIAQRLLRRDLRRIWPRVGPGETLLGLGYATPFLRPFLGEAGRVIAAMPAPQGGHVWPPEGPNLVALVEEFELPYPDQSIDRLVMVHALEFAPAAQTLLRECWRVLRPSGRMVVVVPNRRGIWARVDRTPFGHGNPYSAGQITRLLHRSMFVTGTAETALFAPPAERGLGLRIAGPLERFGRRWLPAVGGVVIIEAQKQVYAATPPGGRRVPARVAVAGRLAPSGRRRPAWAPGRGVAGVASAPPADAGDTGPD